MKPEAFVADWKRSEVSEIQEFVQSADVVGVVDVTGIGAKQMLTMRASLRELGVKLRMSRNRLLKLAITCLLYTSPSPRDLSTSRMPSSA